MPFYVEKLDIRNQILDIRLWNLEIRFWNKVSSYFLISNF